MSARNMFVINAKTNENASNIYDILTQYMASQPCSIVFEPSGYWDEILKLLDCNSYYFSITDSTKHIECEDLFSIDESYDFAMAFPKKQFDNKVNEHLNTKLSFVNDIVKIIFFDPNVLNIEFYVSDQYSITLEDFHCLVSVLDKNLCDALIKTYNPSKRQDYYGMKTAKFLIV